MSKLPPIRVVHEPIDGEFCAVVAYCFKVGRRNMWSADWAHRRPRPVLYGLSVFVIVPITDARYCRQEIGERRFHEVLGTRGRLPYIGPCEAIPGWSDYA